jgi:hypothetical protein
MGYPELGEEKERGELAIIFGWLTCHLWWVVVCLRCKLLGVSGVLFLFQSRLLWSPYYHFSCWDPRWLNIIMFCCFYCAQLCMYVMFLTRGYIFMELWLISFAEHSRRKQEQELWATHVVVLQVKVSFALLSWQLVITIWDCGHLMLLYRCKHCWL